LLNVLVEGEIFRARLVHDVSSGELVQSGLGEIQGCALEDAEAEDIVAVISSGVVFLPTEDTFDTDYQKVYVRTADLVIVSSPLSVLEASDVSALAMAGGSLTDGDYYYAITATDGYGETTIGGIDSATAGAGSNTIRVSWTAVDGALEYNVYRGVSADDLYYLTAFSDPTTAFDDDGSFSIGSAVPPTYNSTGTQYLGRYMSGYTGEIEVRSCLKEEPDGTISRVSANIVQRLVPSGYIALALKLF